MTQTPNAPSDKTQTPRLHLLRLETSDAQQLSGTQEEASGDEGDHLIAALQDIADEEALQRQWQQSRTLHHAIVSAVDEYDEQDWDALSVPTWSSRWGKLQQQWKTWWDTRRGEWQSLWHQQWDPAWSARALAVTLPTVAMGPQPPTLETAGLHFSLERQQPYPLRCHLPQPSSIALFQLDDDPQEVPTLLYPQDPSQLTLRSAGTHELLQLRFPDAGQARFLLCLSNTPWTAFLAHDQEL